jgi:F-type H+-transporting ATPase subunit b
MTLTRLRPAALASAAAAFFVSTAALAQEHGAAAAAEHGGGHEPLNPIPSVNQGLITGLTALVVFCIVFAVLALKVWPTISRGLDERAAKIRSEIEAAEMAQQQARQALKEYEANLARARAEAQKMLDDAKAQQTAIAADLRARAEVELTAMREKAKRDIDGAKRAALAELYEHTGNLAAAMAAKILKREINTADQQRLVQESLTELQTAAARNN